jgi:hypothetical protein
MGEMAQDWNGELYLRVFVCVGLTEKALCGGLVYRYVKLNTLPCRKQYLNVQK